MEIPYQASLLGFCRKLNIWYCYTKEFGIMKICFRYQIPYETLLSGFGMKFDV